MKNKLLYLTKQSLNKKIKSKWFLVVNIILVALIIGLINIDSIISTFGGKFNETKEVLVIDNTNVNYDILNEKVKADKKILEDLTNFKLIKYEKSEAKALKEVKKDDKILLVINTDDNNYMNAKIVSKSYIDTILYQEITSALNSVKQNYALSLSNIDTNELANINKQIDIKREYLDKDKNNAAENMQMIMGTVFPILILPFFILSIFLVQMIGAEVNDEKTTKGMEIIISNVSPKTHFFSKVIAGNLFVFIQACILILAATLGLVIRKNVGASSIVNTGFIDFKSLIDTLNNSGIMDKLGIVVILTLILLILSFIAYSLIAGILASMTTNVEDYQQVQTPIVIVSLIGYYLAMMAPMFNGSIFIKIMSYVPLISSLLSPALFIMGQISIIDVIISIVVMIILLFILVRYGLRIYKVGILNYSSDKIWSKIFKALKDGKKI